MRIVFLCGCLEPGCDGVGDYTIKLVEELINKGYKLSVIALNDKYVNEVISHSSNKYYVHRLPANLREQKRFQLARELIYKFKPDWISLQFVIYAYHPKGLPVRLAKSIGGLKTQAKWHIMFHEIWVGVSKTSSLKHKVIGYVQKRIIISIVKTLQPTIITTSNILYLFFLKKINIEAIILPLFSNIPVATKNNIFLKYLLAELNLKTEAELISWRLTGSFGTMRKEINLEQILQVQQMLCFEKGLKLAFIAFGRIGDEGRSEFDYLKNKLTHIKFVDAGEQSEENVSNIMQLLNIGISGTPLSFLGKSGVFSSMKLHDLAVVIHKDKHFPQYEKELNEYLHEILEKKPESWGVTNVANDFLNLLLK